MSQCWRDGLLSPGMVNARRLGRSNPATRAAGRPFEGYQRLQVGGNDGSPSRWEATAVIAIAAAVPLRGVTDARPEMARGVAVEDRTAGAYETVRDRFTANRRGLTPPAGSAPTSIHARTAPRTRA